MLVLFEDLRRAETGEKRLDRWRKRFADALSLVVRSFKNRGATAVTGQVNGYREGCWPAAKNDRGEMHDRVLPMTSTMEPAAITTYRFACRKHKVSINQSFFDMGA